MYSQDSKLPAEFDVTEQAGKSGRVSIALVVLSWCDGAFLEDQDMWWLSGITREVWFYRRPKLQLFDTFLRATPLLVSTNQGGGLADVLSPVDGILDINIKVRTSTLP